MHFLQFNSAISKRSSHTLRVEHGEKAMPASNGRLQEAKNNGKFR